MSPRALPLLLSCLLPAIASSQPADPRIVRAGESELRIEVAGDVDAARARLLQDWAEGAARSLLTVSDRFPLASARVRIDQVDSRDRSPVPWGQTSRRDGVSVLLFVRRDAGLQALRDDWTAEHELAHLMHPYLGREGRWMAEGLASYYQNVLRARSGRMDGEQAWRRLDAGFARGRRATTGTPLSSLHGRGATMRIYWAGAAYWLQADLALRARGSSLDAVLDGYARCCLRAGSELAPLAFARALDRIDGHDIFVGLYRQYAAASAFPDLAAAYRTLGLSGGGDMLRFSRGDAPARLRAAIMRKAPR